MWHDITLAFEHRQRPTAVTTIVENSTLRDDAYHFAELDWRQVSAEDWQRYSDAFYGLAPEAFVYFLPSLLVASLDLKHLVAADALVSLLDTSAEPDIWPEWFVERVYLLTEPELTALRKWSERYLNDAPRGEGSEYARVQDTLTMLELRLKA